MERPLTTPERILCSRFCPALREGRAFLHPRILKVAANPEIISFAGGLPNPHLFPVKAIDQACQDVLREQGAAALQYAATEGFAPLRQYIADRYLARHGMQVNPDNILITSGSQQALDLLGKVLIDEGQDLIIEEPGYLGAIQAFSVYQPAFKPITLGEEGWIWRRWMRCWRAAPTPSCCTACPTSRTRAASPTAVPTARHWHSDWSATSC